MTRILKKPAKFKYLGREECLEGEKSLQHISKSMRAHMFGLILGENGFHSILSVFQLLCAMCFFNCLWLPAYTVLHVVGLKIIVSSYFYDLWKNFKSLDFEFRLEKQICVSSVSEVGFTSTYQKGFRNQSGWSVDNQQEITDFTAQIPKHL